MGKVVVKVTGRGIVYFPYSGTIVSNCLRCIRPMHYRMIDFLIADWTQWGWGPFILKISSEKHASWILNKPKPFEKLRIVKSSLKCGENERTCFGLRIVFFSQFFKVSMRAMVKKIVSNEGFTGLYRGIGANMLKVIPAVSISYACYEEMRSMLKIWLATTSKMGFSRFGFILMVSWPCWMEFRLNAIIKLNVDTLSKLILFLC